MAREFYYQTKSLRTEGSILEGRVTEREHIPPENRQIR